MPLSLPEAFGLAVRELRAERNVTQEAAALNGDIDRSFLGKVERAETNPTLGTVEKVAAALDVQPSDLVIRAERVIERHAG